MRRVNTKLFPTQINENKIKKILSILFVLLGLGITANAQDVILKKDGSEITSKVLEITDQQIKYKEFDFQDGPIRNLNISEVFMITYENGKKEVFVKPNEKKDKSCIKELAFGLDVGLGGSFASFSGYSGMRSESLFSSALGIRVTHHINPYLAIDFLKINCIVDVGTEEYYYDNYFSFGYSYIPGTIRMQFMPGIRGNTPQFYKCMSGYAAFRLGYGIDIGEFHFQGLCLETELGMNFTSTIFAGFTYNYHRYFGNLSGAEMHAFSFRLGFNFGK